MINALHLLWIVPLSIMVGLRWRLCLQRRKERNIGIVRCKDCKHGKETIFGIWCSGKMMPEDWFCKDGEPGGSGIKE